MLNYQKGVDHFDANQDYLRTVDAGKYASIVESIYGPSKAQQLQYRSYFATKAVGAATSFRDLFKSDDSIATLSTSKMTNVANAKLEADKVFCLTHIQLLFGNNATLNATAFGRLSDAILDGTFEMKQNDRPIVPQSSCRMFDNIEQYSEVATGDTNAAAGTAVTYTMNKVQAGAGIFELPKPKFLFPQQSISVVLDFCVTTASNDNIKIILHGVENVNNM